MRKIIFIIIINLLSINLYSQDMGINLGYSGFKPLYKSGYIEDTLEYKNPLGNGFHLEGTYLLPLVELPVSSEFTIGFNYFVPFKDSIMLELESDNSWSNSYRTALTSTISKAFYIKSGYEIKQLNDDLFIVVGYHLGLLSFKSTVQSEFVDKNGGWSTWSIRNHYQFDDQNENGEPVYKGKGFIFGAHCGVYYDLGPIRLHGELSYRRVKVLMDEATIKNGITPQITYSLGAFIPLKKF